MCSVRVLTRPLSLSRILNQSWLRAWGHNRQHNHSLRQCCDSRGRCGADRCGVLPIYPCHLSLVSMFSVGVCGRLPVLLWASCAGPC